MKCPFCEIEIKKLAIHIKEKHPRKFRFLEKHRPQLYLKLKKELEISNLIESKNQNLFIFRKENKIEYYKYKCIRCGNCCRNNYDISIRKEDILQWGREKRVDILNSIQINPTSIAKGNLGAYNIDDKDMGNEKKNIERAIKRIEDTKKRIEEDPQFLEDLSKFIISKHNYMGENESSSLVPNWFLPNVGYRAVFSPKSFKVLLEGWKKDLRYMMIMDLKGQCELLDDNNLCTIHNVKPKDCKGYPKKDYLEKNENDFLKFIKTCKGVKRIK